MLDAKKIEAMRQGLKEGVTVVVTPQLFPTPTKLVKQMIEIANVTSFDQVLEPSAGTGAILKELPDCDTVAIEINQTMCNQLERHFKDWNIICNDFMNCNHRSIGKFDKILMNPPFKGGQDIEHVIHAYSFLKEGGTLVAIMCEGPFFRQDKKSTGFRTWLDEYGYSEKLPAETFKSSGTNVNCRIVVIEKGELK